MPEDAPGNPGAVRTDAQPAGRQAAQYRKVREMQAKLHRWAGEDRSRRFGDLFNLVSDLEFLAEGWLRVKANAGSKTPGIDKATVAGIENRIGAGGFLDRIRDWLKSGEFRPAPGRQVMIPKKSGKLRKLGIATVTDRVVQAALKLVLDPIFEADFQPCSYGFRPNRRAHDAIAEIQLFATQGYTWVLEADIRACLDPWSYCSFADFLVQKRPSCEAGTSIRRPFLRPVRVRTARSSPCLTFCNTVWRETPSVRLAWCRASQPSGAVAVSMPRSWPVRRMGQGAPGGTCSPAMKPSLSQRNRVEGAILSSRAAWATLSSSPSAGGWPPGW